jgi:Phosphotransferase enzyme family
MGGDAQRAIETFLGGSNCHIGLLNNDASRPTVTFCRGSSRPAIIKQLESSGFTRIHTFGVIPSARRPRWIIPLDRRPWASAGLRVFQPFAITAKLLKPLLVAATRLGWTDWARDHAIVASRSPWEIEALVTEITGERRPVFAFSLGTPGNFRKLSVRVMRPNGDLLGYVKLPLTPLAIARVRREAAVLKQLHLCHLLRPQIPRVLYAGDWGSGFILFQSAKESKRVPVRFGDLHRTFLEHLSAVESVQTSGNELVTRVARNWSAAEPKLPTRWRAAGSHALRVAHRELQNNKVRCGISHGDFTPWNTLVSARQLFVFDWESAESQLPHNWDLFHFRVQASIFLKRTRGEHLTLDQESGERASFLLYLLDSARGYLEEGSAAAATALEYRYKLLNNQFSAG